MDPAVPIHSLFLKLKEALLKAPALTLPNPTIAFIVYALTQGHNVVGVLGHLMEPLFQVVAYLSKQVDNTVCEWHPCLCALAVAAILTQEAQKFTLV